MALSLKPLILSAGLLAALVPVQATAEGRSIIVLDASGSMWGQIDGRAKLEIARDALADVLATVPPETELGLMAYGHRTKGDCADIELLVPPAAGSAAAISEAARNLKFLGKTPLTEAVRQAAADLKSTEEKATVILITDGIETCNADPCALGKELEASGVDFTAHVVGFGLSKEEGQQVACLAENTGGTYIEAKDATGLVEALKTTVVAAPAPAPEPELEPAPKPAATKVDLNLQPRLYLVEGGPEVPNDKGNRWELFSKKPDGSQDARIDTFYGNDAEGFPPGDYILRGGLDEAEGEMLVTLTDTAQTEAKLVLNAGWLHIEPYAAEGAEIADGAGVEIWRDGARISTHYGDTTRLNQAGDYEVKINLGAARASAKTTVKAGETTDLKVVMEAGVALINSFYVDGLKMEGQGEALTVFAAKKKIDGSRENVGGTAYGEDSKFTLPVGDYVVVMEKGGVKVEHPFSVKSGDLVEVNVIANAGVLFVSAPGATGIEVLDAKKDISGNQKSIDFSYDAEKTMVLPVGEFIARATFGDATKDKVVTIAAGERTEVTLP